MNLSHFDSEYYGSIESLKWAKYQGTQIIPMWLAESDFPIHPAITESLSQRLANPRLGYPSEPESLRDAICQHCFEQYGWKIEPSWITFSGNVTSGLGVTRVITHVEKSKLMGVTFVPNYPRLFTSPYAIDFSHCTPKLAYSDGRWRMDLNLINQNYLSEIGIFFLCNPHNPVGRVYTKRELEDVASMCEKHDWIICSDEIHSDLVLSKNRHIPIASICPEIADRTITLMGPGKTFNVSGLEFSFSIIPNKRLRTLYQRVSDGMTGTPNLFAYNVALSAYKVSKEWIHAQTAILERNLAKVEDLVLRNAALSMSKIEGTFLAWLDVSQLQLDDPVSFFEQHGVGLADGSKFKGENFVRLNFACNESMLTEALSRIERACLDRLN